MAAALGLVGGVGSLVGGLSGLFSHSGGAPQPGPYNPTFSSGQLQGLAGSAQQQIGDVQSFAPYSGAVPNQVLNQIAPQFGNIAQNIGNNAFVQPAVTGAVNASRLAPYLSGQQLGAGMGLTGAGLSQIPYLQQTLNTAYDPQNALYQRMLQQVQNQQNVQNAQSGVATTPYGASLADLNLQNFNIDWQNNLLQRQLLGAQGAGQLGSNIQGLTGAGLQYGMMAPQTLSVLSALPYQTYVGQQQNVSNALGTEQNALMGAQQSAANAINAYNVPFNDYTALLGAMSGVNQTGINAYTAQNQAQLAAQGQQFNQNAWYGQQAGAGLYGIGKGLSSLPGLNLGFGGQMG